MTRRTHIPSLLILSLLALAACSGKDQGSEKTGPAPTPEKVEEPSTKHDTEPEYSEFTPPSTGGLARLEIEVLKPGFGPEIQVGDSVRVHAMGTFASDGTKFWSSYDTGQPAEFTVAPGQVIEGWVRGLAGQKEGSTVRLSIPSNLAYGAKGRDGIPPNSDLIFEIEIQKVTKK